MKRALKVVHLLSSIGLMGGYATDLVLIFNGPTHVSLEFLALRVSMEAIARWLLVPSLALVCLSGLFAIAVHAPFQEMAWVWAKALSGLLVLEATLHLHGAALEAVTLTHGALSDAAEAALLEKTLHAEQMVLWVMLAVALANVVLGVWRPRFRFAVGR